jgi:hypothetical protein
MKKLKYQILNYCLFICLCTNAQSIDSKMSLNEGNKTYKNGNYDTSVYNYQSSFLADTSNISAIYNNGNAAYMKGDFEEARSNFKKYINSSTNNIEKANAHFNIGNSLLTEYQQEVKSQKKQPNNELLQNAVEEYKSSIRLNNNDDDARYNLSYAMRLIQQNKDQQNKDQNDKDQDNKDQSEKDQNKKDQNEKDQDNKDQKNKDQQNKDQQNKDQQKKDRQNEDNKQKIEDKQTKQQAMKNLDAVNSDEEKILLKVNRKKGDQKKKSKTKDW